MRSLLRPLSLILCLCATVHAAAADMIERVASPDGHIVLELAQKMDAAGKRALSYKPDYVAACITLGHALIQSGHADEATQSYDRAIALSVGSISAHGISGGTGLPSSSQA